MRFVFRISGLNRINFHVQDSCAYQNRNVTDIIADVLSLNEKVTSRLLFDTRYHNSFVNSI